MARGVAKKAAHRRQANGIQAGSKGHPRPSAAAHKAPVEMKKKERKPKDSIQYILQRLSEIPPQDVNADSDDTSSASATMEIDATPEEGRRLIRAFIRIKHPELRAAIVKLTTRVANVKISK
jgi:hypothetical protein